MGVRGSRVVGVLALLVCRVLGAFALAVLGPARACPPERALGSAAFAGGRAAAESA